MSTGQQTHLNVSLQESKGLIGQNLFLFLSMSRIILKNNETGFMPREMQCPTAVPEKCCAAGGLRFQVLHFTEKHYAYPCCLLVEVVFPLFYIMLSFAMCIRTLLSVSVETASKFH